ncbi:MAG: heme uptake protein IsdC [Lysinibacillus sp.]
MKKIVLFVMLVSFVAFNFALPQASAQMADGSYSLKYQVNKPDSNTPSIANDYFLKPAKVTLKNGTATVQITLKNSKWITKFQPGSGAKVVSEDKAADTRVVQFTVKDLSKPVIAAMKIDIDDINYHHEYSVALASDAAAITGGTTATTGDKTPTTTNTSTDGGQVSNPQTSDATPYLLIVALAGSAFLLYRKKFYSNSEGQ